MAAANNFKKTCSLKERVAESSSVRRNHPDRIPIICERDSAANDALPLLHKSKYLVPEDLTVAQFVYVLRKRLALRPEMAFFVFVDGHIPSAIMPMRQLYATSRDEDGFLYLRYTSENAFGS